MTVLLTIIVLWFAISVFYKEFVKPEIYEQQIKGNIPYKKESPKRQPTIQDAFKK